MNPSKEDYLTCRMAPPLYMVFIGGGDPWFVRSTGACGGISAESDEKIIDAREVLPVLNPQPLRNTRVTVVCVPPLPPQGVGQHMDDAKLAPAT